MKLLLTGIAIALIPVLHAVLKLFCVLQNKNNLLLKLLCILYVLMLFTYTIAPPSDNDVVQ